MNDKIYQNQTINSTLLHFAPAFQRRVPAPPPQGGRRFGFSMPETFKMLEPCKNLGGGRVRLTYYNPDAKSVSVFGIGGSMPGEYPMEKDGDGYRPGPAAGRPPRRSAHGIPPPELYGPLEGILDLHPAGIRGASGETVPGALSAARRRRG